jgi:hypothetical protein
VGSGGDVYLFLNNRQGSFKQSGKASLPAAGEYAIGDVNGDKIPDVVSVEGCVALGEGNLKFAPPVCYPVADGIASFNVVLADLRNNGLLDIVAGEWIEVSVLLNQGNGKFEDGRWVSVPGSGNCAAAADFNGDGKPDLAILTPQGIVILLGTGKASPTPQALPSRYPVRVVRSPEI